MLIGTAGDKCVQCCFGVVRYPSNQPLFADGQHPNPGERHASSWGRFFWKLRNKKENPQQTANKKLLSCSTHFFTFSFFSSRFLLKTHGSFGGVKCSTINLVPLYHSPASPGRSVAARSFRIILKLPLPEKAFEILLHPVPWRLCVCVEFKLFSSFKVKHRVSLFYFYTLSLSYLYAWQRAKGSKREGKSLGRVRVDATIIVNKLKNINEY